MNVVITNNFYNKLREILYPIFVIVSLVPIFIELTTNIETTDGHMQKLLLDHSHSHSNYDKVNFIFTFSVGLGSSYLPSLLIDTLKFLIFKDIYYDILLYERYILTFTYLTPSLLTIINIFNECQYTALVYLSTFRVTFISICYITSRVLTRTTTNIWTPKLTTCIFIINGLLSGVPFFRSYPLNVTVVISYITMLLYFSIKYFKQADICKILFGNNKDEWKEIIVYSSTILSLIHIFVLIISITTVNRTGLRNPNLTVLYLFHINKTFTFIILSSIYSTVPGTLSAIQNSTITSLRTFIRHLSHEVRTPMNVVQMNLETISDKIIKIKPILSFQDYEELIDITNESVESSEVAVNVLNEILEVDKITQGLEKYEKENINFGKFIEKTCRIFVGKAVTKKVILDYSKYENYKNIIVNLDVNKIGMVLRNFISNALKFTNENDTIQLNINLIYKNIKKIENKNIQIIPDEENQIYNFIRVEVVDNGIGISQENIGKLFNSSIQIEAAKNQDGKGSGFGLLIAKKHVEAHNGYIGVNSDGLGKGSTFWFELPFEPLLEERITTPIQKIKKEIELVDSIDFKIKLKGESPNILIAEDVPSNAKVLSRLLVGLNCNTKIVENGDLCVDEIKSNDIYDLIFMDNQMPIMTGPEASKKIRELGYTLPIIGLTGNIMEDDINYFMEQGANKVLGKPTKKDKLNDILNKYLEL